MNVSGCWSGCLDLGYVLILVTSRFRDNGNRLDLGTLPVHSKVKRSGQNAPWVFSMLHFENAIGVF